MIDIVILAVAAATTLTVALRKTSAGVAILSLLAGVMLDQLLSGWILQQLPKATGSLTAYIPAAIHLGLILLPVIVSIVAVKVDHHSMILSIVTGLLLGFLVMFFSIKVLAALPLYKQHAGDSGVFTFLAPYQNAILAASTVLALVEMVMSHRKKSLTGKGRHKKRD